MRDLIYVIAIDVALEKLGEKALYHCLQYSSPEESVKKFMSGSKEDGKILVTSKNLIKGYEHPIIIDTSKYFNISSRTSSKLVRISSNLFLDQIVIYEQLLKDGKHHCQNMMEREVRPKPDLDISTFIGKFFKI